MIIVEKKPAYMSKEIAVHSETGGILVLEHAFTIDFMVHRGARHNAESLGNIKVVIHEGKIYVDSFESLKFDGVPEGYGVNALPSKHKYVLSRIPKASIQGFRIEIEHRENEGLFLVCTK